MGVVREQERVRWLTSESLTGCDQRAVGDGDVRHDAAADVAVAQAGYAEAVGDERVVVVAAAAAVAHTNADCLTHHGVVSGGQMVLEMAGCWLTETRDLKVHVPMMRWQESGARVFR